jgi:hypothetical protein
MARFMISVLLLQLLLATTFFAQSGAIIPEHGAGHAQQPSCVLLKRMGPADQVTSHLYSFGIRGKQFQYVEGKLPDGFPFHGRLTDHDVRNLQACGAEVIVLNQNYTPDELQQARSDCQGVTGKTPIQEGEKAIALPTQSPFATPAATANSSPAAPATAAAGDDLNVSSTPSGADIEVDGKFVGNTPSSINLAAGDHNVVVKKNGFAAWTRKITISGGHVTLNAELAPASK